MEALATRLMLTSRSRISPLRNSSFLQSRTKSTDATQPNTPAPETSKTSLTWSEYLTIKAKKRRWQTAVTIPCGLAGFAGGVSYFGNLDTDPLKPIMGIDPFFFYGFCTLGCVGVGALIGPTIGTALWRYTHRNVLDLIDAKDHEFFDRIAKNRVDASLQSPTNPVPDYYGEKIGSIHQYRQWLRDQNKYKRKVVLPEE